MTDNMLTLARESQRKAPAANQEAFRVLETGGRFAVSEVVVRRPAPEDVRQDLELSVGCIAGALADPAYRRRRLAAGLKAIEGEPWRTRSLDKIGIAIDAVPEDALAGALTRTTKPAAKSNGGPTCCAS